MSKGAYLLIIFLESKKKIRTKGRTFTLEPGYYVYVGSGMRSLEKRVLRHFRRKKKLHWHIDYLLKEAELLRAYLIFSSERLEERLSLEVGRYGEPVKGFGSSDLKVKSNLYRFDSRPDKVIVGILDKMNVEWKRIDSAGGAGAGI
ncbi:hypothetical protein PNA2_1238 [Pyrococcus sp. NA2]|uniref:GIY-YIG nuclease family protein n=1 Tax=Pyrococcus sp. (strain NA2) TaxID=342949 RepID=UPI000209AC64|nr:DUF123 domain-containing protein [Pyrococcus sp. NA2]AEC52153.1 hypothetical protein PNA2_1238 [Pyrococcus sp. NA2]